MTLRVRLLLGYWYLALLLLAVAIGSIFGFLHLSAGIDRVLENNFRSIEAAMQMIESLERQDSATLEVLLLGDDEPARWESVDLQFRHALGTARGNVTEAPERAVLERIEAAYEEYVASRRELLAASVATPLAAYRERVFPAFERVKSEAVDLLRINQEAMFEAESEARRTAMRSGIGLGALVALALASLILLSMLLQRHVLSRLWRLQEAMAAVGEGEEGRRLRETGDDELAEVARQFNRVLDRRQEMEAQAAGRVAQERRLVVALVEAAGPRHVLFDARGLPIAGGRSNESDRQAVEKWIRGRSAAPDGDGDGEGDGGEVEVDLPEGRRAWLRPLRVAGRPVGWLARLEE